MPPMEPLAVFHLAEEGAFSEGLLQIARALDDGSRIYSGPRLPSERQANG